MIQNPYPNLLGIEWEFDNNVVLNLKQRHMSFEMDTLPIKGDIYVALFGGFVQQLVAPQPKVVLHINHIIQSFLLQRISLLGVYTLKNALNRLE
jgi:hypothetical protein